MLTDRILYLYALPIILLAVFGEYIYRRHIKKNTLANLSSNLLCGLIDRLFFLFFGVLQYKAMVWLSNYSLLTSINNKFLNAIFVFLVVDFVWYLYHRMAHTVPILWAFHSTHHQTDDFNLSLGLRVSFLQQIVRSFFWIPIALLGFDPKVILTAIFFQSFYQFFIHTDLYESPTFVRKLFVSPKLHKIHHSNQTKYHNKNYGGVLIIWDKILRTFLPYHLDEVITLKSKEDPILLSPFNGYFTPFINWISPFYKQQPKINKTKSISKKGLFKVFILVVIPSLFLILKSNSLELKTITIYSILLIIIIFLMAQSTIKT